MVQNSVKGPIYGQPHPVCIHADDPIARSISAEKLHLATAVTTTDRGYGEK